MREDEREFEKKNERNTTPFVTRRIRFVRRNSGRKAKKSRLQSARERDLAKKWGERQWQWQWQWRTKKANSVRSYCDISY